MLPFIAVVVLVTGASAEAVPSFNMPRLNNALHISEPTARKASRIINGEVAGTNEFPHQLSLLYFGSHRCGASLLTNEWAITAAHCVDGILFIRQLTLSGGITDLSKRDEGFSLNIDYTVMHENYDQGPGGFPNDIALLKLSAHEFDLSSYTIGLASDSYDFANDLCLISGWGVTEDGTGGSDILMKAEVEVLSHDDCVNKWGSSYILPQHICVWGQEGDRSGACNGDSGGPLTCNGVLAGLTSWGRTGCHTDGVVGDPSVYVRISYFYNWIRENCNNCV